MKFLIALIFLTFSSLSYAQINIAANFNMQTSLPLDSRAVAPDLTARDAISALRRYEGLIVYVVSEATNFQLIGGITNDDWLELSGSGGGLNEWTNTADEYEVGDVVIFRPTGMLYICVTTHVPSTDFIDDIANWDEFANPFLNTNLAIAGNTLSSTDVDGNIILDPNGTGIVEITKDLSVTGTGAIDDISIVANKISATVLNDDLVLAGNGTGDVKFERDAVEFVTGSINPELGELMKYPSFEESDAEVTVTNATKALVANNFHGTQALQCTGTGANARCCVEVAVPAQREGIRHEVSCNLKTADTGVEFTLRNNSTDRGSYEVASNNEWTAYSFLADATDSIGFCIDQADTDVTLVDKCSITSNLSKRAAVDCANELDCENVFSAKVSETGVISDASPIPWLTCTNTAGVATCTYESGLVTSPMNCTAIVAENSQNVFAMPTLSATGFVFQNNSVGTSRPFSVQCVKSGSDYKTIPERGVINVNMDAQNDTDWKAYTPTFQGFGTPTDVSCFFKKNGANADISCAFVSGTPTGVEARVGLPSGLVISGSIPSGNFSIDRATRFAGGSAYEKNLAVLASVGHTYVGFSSIDQTSTGSPAVRLLGTQFMGAGQSLSVNFSVPIQGWTARQEIVVDISETRFVSGGVEVKTIDTWDGEPIYRRCYEVATDITTTADIATIPAGLILINSIEHLADIYVVQSGVGNVGRFSWVDYNKSTGTLRAVVDTSQVGAGTKFCMEYLK